MIAEEASSGSDRRVREWISRRRRNQRKYAVEWEFMLEEVFPAEKTYEQWRSGNDPTPLLR